MPSCLRQKMPKPPRQPFRLRRKIPISRPRPPRRAEPPEPTRLKSDPVEPIGDLAPPNVTTNRLPTVGAEDAEAEEPEVTAASPPLAIERNAADFDRPDGVPMMSVVLRDAPPAARASWGGIWRACRSR